MSLLADTVARPYAKAIFTIASEQDQLDQWLVWLDAVAQWITLPAVVGFFEDPRFSPALRDEQLMALFTELVGPLEAEHQQLIHLLVAYKRLAILPKIAQIFRQLLAEYRQQVDVQVTTPLALTDAQREQLRQSLVKRLSCHVTLSCAIDRALIGGAVIRIGDTVIDGSLRGKLNRLHRDLEENRI